MSAEMIMPCRTQNSVETMAFFLSTDTEMDLEALLKIYRQETSFISSYFSAPVKIRKHSDSDCPERITEILMERLDSRENQESALRFEKKGIHVFFKNYRRWNHTFSLIKDCLQELTPYMNEIAVENIFMAYLDRFIIPKNFSGNIAQSMFRQNDYFAPIFFKNGMLEYSLSIPKLHKEDFFERTSFSIFPEIDENEQRTFNMYIDTNTKYSFNEHQAFASLLTEKDSLMESLTNEMHTSLKTLFQNLIHPDLLVRIGMQ